ncbi:unnamed protein product [Discosporangium mesarthrocarpum]
MVGSTMAAVKVTADAKLEGVKRINLTFRRSEYSPQTLLGLDVSTLPPLGINFPQAVSNVGWLDTTYVDEDLRIGRALGGNLFVLTRV